MQVTPSPSCSPPLIQQSTQHLAALPHAGPLVQLLGDDGDHVTTALSYHKLPTEEVRRDPSGRFIIQPMVKR